MHKIEYEWKNVKVDKETYNNLFGLCKVCYDLCKPSVNKLEFNYQYLENELNRITKDEIEVTIEKGEDDYSLNVNVVFSIPCKLLFKQGII